MENQEPVLEKVTEDPPNPEPQPEPTPEPTPEPSENKITVPPKKKEKDPKKVAQGKRLAQISEKAKREKMRREIEEESQIDLSMSYHTLAYFGAPLLVFAGMYLYFSSKNVAPETKHPEPPPKQRSPEKKSKKQQHVSLFD